MMNRHMSEDGGQAVFINRIHSAIGRPAGVPLDPDAVMRSHETDETHAILSTVRRRSRDDRMELLNQLIDAAKPLHLKVKPVADLAEAAEDIRRTALDRAPEWGNAKSVFAWRHPLVDRLNLTPLLAADGIPVCTPNGLNGSQGRLRRQVIDACIGVTGADYCVAESATLVMKTRPGQPRIVSLVPSIHIAVIRLDQILSRFRELYTLLAHDPAEKAEGLSHVLTFVSGPSKTADIEAQMVLGAHGPREMAVLVVTG